MRKWELGSGKWEVGSGKSEVVSWNADFAGRPRVSARDGRQGFGIDDELAHWLLFL
jgi:hypothetical protein